MRAIPALVPAILLLAIGGGAGAADWRGCRTAEDVVRDYPARVQYLFDHLDLGNPQLADVKAAWESGKKAEACRALIVHYEKSPAGDPYRSKEGKYSLRRANKPMNDELIASGLWFKIPRAADGGILWSYEGPPTYTNNQMHQISRHGWMRDMLFAGLDGKGDKYLVKLDEYLRDWCAHTEEYKQFSPRRAAEKLNAGIRIGGPWPMLFYSFLPCPQFQDSTKILMLAATAEHAPFLRKHHAKKGNHRTTEVRALATEAVAFPEFRDGKGNLVYAEGIFKEDLRDSFYVEEGVQKELTQTYHIGVVRSFEEMCELFERSGMEVDPVFGDVIERGWESVALTCKPNGHGLLLNDSNDQSYARLIKERAAYYKRPDWVYPYTHGEKGVKPERGPSVMFAWSGRLVSRDDWGKGARWSVFDIGPFGIGHQHNDKLHLSVFAHGRDLLVDSGRFTYRNYGSRSPNDMRGYVRRSWGHNVILVDGQSQNDDDNVASQPARDWAITDTYDFALGSFDKGWEGKRNGRHQRALFDIKGKFWIVCDRIDLEKPAAIEALWHFHPHCAVPQPEGLAVATTDADKGNLRISPVTSGDVAWTVEVVKGRKEPTIQGWFSRIQNEIVPSPCAIYEAKGVKTARFAWLIVTGEGTPPEYTTEIRKAPEGVIQVAVSDANGSVCEVAVDFVGDAKGALEGGLSLANRHAVRILR